MAEPDDRYYSAAYESRLSSNSYPGVSRQRHYQEANESLLRTLESIRELVVRLARETGWGYCRIVGELKKLRIHNVSRTNVKNILAEARIKPGPKRNQGTWDEFLKIHAETLWQVDFFNSMVVTPTGLKRAFVLAFIHVGSRRVFCSPSTFKPNKEWMVTQAESMLEQARDAKLPMKYLVRDRDTKYCREFDELFEKAGVSIEPTAPRSPNQNAYIERWIGSLRSECLSRFVLFGKKHLDYIVSEYLNFYNELRPHQSLENRPLQGDWPKLDEPPTDKLEVVSHHRLGGVLKHYERIAA